MISCFHRSSDGRVTADLAATEWPAALAEKDGMLWVDFEEAPEDMARHLLIDVFKFHPLAVDDAIQEVHVPKVDDFNDYAYLVVHGMSIKPVNGVVETVELDIFLGANFVVTLHSGPMRSIAACKEAIDRRLALRPDMFIAELLDSLVAHYMDNIDQFDEELDAIEDAVFEQTNEKTLSRIFSFKRSILNIRRIIIPQREVLNRLARGDFAVIQPSSRIYFRDVYDHLVRIADLLENQRDLATGALETYLSVTSNRLNEVMRVLTVVTVILMPLTLIAGIYGMNFQHMPELGWRYGYFGVLGFMAALTVALVLYFRRRRWI